MSAIPFDDNKVRVVHQPPEAKKPGFDLQAHRAAAAEATFETFPVYLGVRTDDDGRETIDKVEIPPTRQWPIDAQEILSNNPLSAIEMMIGPDATALFRSYRWTVGEFLDLFDEISRWSGFQTGPPSAPQPEQGSTPN